MKKNISVVAGMLYKKGKFLIGRRLPDDLGGGYWEFPGGKREEKESSEHCLIRELNEELGIVVESFSFFTSYDYEHPDKIYDLCFYLVTGYKGSIIMNAHDKLEWVSIDDMKNYKLLPGESPLMKKLNEENFK